jgi:hypothetical protein
MAKTYFDDMHRVNVEAAQLAFSKAIDMGQVAKEEWEKYAPKSYTFEDVMKEAQRLYGFVNKKD